MTNAFFRFDLRTTHEHPARAFYERLFGHDRATVWPLHEDAIARGAKPHWLGHLDVPDVDGAVAAFAERGATPLRSTFTRNGMPGSGRARPPAGLSDWEITGLLAQYEVIARAYAVDVTEEVGQLRGRAPRSFLEFARDERVLAVAAASASPWSCAAGRVRLLRG